MIVHSLISSLGLMTSSPSAKRRLVVVTPRKASYKDLSVYHTRDYLDAILDTGNPVGKKESEAEPNHEFGLEDVKYYAMLLRSF
jgi:histone deacetylase 8